MQCCCSSGEERDNTPFAPTTVEAVYLADTLRAATRPRLLHAGQVQAFRERDFKLKSASEFRAVEKQLLDLLYTTPTR